MTDADPGETRTLNYSLDGRQRRRRRITRRVLPVILFLAVAVVVIGYRRELAVRGRAVYWGWKCAHHVTPRGTVLVESDPAKVDALVANDRDYLWDGQQTFALPAVLVSRSSVTPLSAVYWPKDLQEYCRFVTESDMMMSGTRAVVFMGARVSAAGHRRLVVIPFAELNALDAERELAFSHVMPLPDLLGRIQPLQQSPKAYQFTGRFVPMRLSPGVSDPADASRVSVDYEAGENWKIRHGMIDLYLRDDDTLAVRFRDPGAKASFHGRGQ